MTGDVSGGSVASSTEESEGTPSALDDDIAPDPGAGPAANRKQIRGSSLLVV